MTKPFRGIARHGNVRCAIFRVPTAGRGDVFMCVTTPGAEMGVVEVDAARFLELCRRPSFVRPSLS
jgi:hypothetical protein